MTTKVPKTFFEKTYFRVRSGTNGLKEVCLLEKSDLLSSLYKSKAKKCAIFFSTVFNFPPLKKLNCFFIKRKSLLCSKKLEE